MIPRRSAGPDCAPAAIRGAAPQRGEAFDSARINATPRRRSPREGRETRRRHRTPGQAGGDAFAPFPAALPHLAAGLGQVAGAVVGQRVDQEIDLDALFARL